MPGTELFGAEERKEIEDVLSTGIMFRFNHDAQRNNIWKAKDFEAEAKKITGAKYALAVSNGSAAILAALAASGIGTGDEVICPPFTYIATIEAVLSTDISHRSSIKGLCELYFGLLRTISQIGRAHV